MGPKFLRSKWKGSRNRAVLPRLYLNYFNEPKGNEIDNIVEKIKVFNSGLHGLGNHNDYDSNSVRTLAPVRTLPDFPYRI